MKEVKEEEYKEQMTVQLHEIYASIWSNEKVTFQFIDVLSTINPIHLRRINETWNNNTRIPFISCFGRIIREILKQLKESLINLTQTELKQKADEVLSIVGSFEGIFDYLAKMGYDETHRLIINWKRIHLSLICTAICVKDDRDNNNDNAVAMDGEFIANLYNKFQTFDKIEDLQWLINEIKQKLQSNRLQQVAVNDLLQYLYQIFVTDFAFTKQTVVNNNENADQQRNAFLQDLIAVCSEEQEVKLNNDQNDGNEEEKIEENAIGLQLDPFSKLQTLSKILELTRVDEEEKKVTPNDVGGDGNDNDDVDEENKDDEKEERKQVDPDTERKKIEAGLVVNRLENAVANATIDVNIDNCSLALYLLSTEEQYLYYKYKKDNQGKNITKVDFKIVKAVVARLNESFEKTKLEQLLAIAEAKLIIFYFVRFVSAALRKKKMLNLQIKD